MRLLRPQIVLRIGERLFGWAKACWKRRPGARILRARAAIFWGLLAYCALHVGLLVALQESPVLRDPVFGDRTVQLKKRIKAATTGQPKVVVMLGTSRTGYGFDAGHAERILRTELGKPIVAHNLGVPGAGPITMYVYLQRMLDAGIRPDLLIYEIHPKHYSEINGKPYECCYMLSSRFWGSEQDVLREHGVPISLETEERQRLFINPWSEYRFQLLQRVRPKLMPRDIGWNWNEGCDVHGSKLLRLDAVPPGEYPGIFERVRQEYEPVLTQFHMSLDCLAAMRKTLDLCNRSGIRVVLVDMPEGSDLRKLYPAATRADFNETMALMARHYDCAFIDANTWIPDSDFYDAHHMLMRGAQRFTERLTRESLRVALER